MYKMAVIGDKDSIYGFASLGIGIFPCEDEVQASKTLRELAKSGYGVIYVTEALFELLSDDVEHYRDLPLPAIIPIPGVKGNTGIGMKNVSLSVEKAVGSDIIS